MEQDTRFSCTSHRTEVVESEQYSTAYEGVGVRNIAGLKLPQFSGFSFVSKVRMFLDPNNFVVMDIQIMKLREAGLPTILYKVVHNDKETIRVTETNESAYEQWCGLCLCKE